MGSSRVALTNIVFLHGKAPERSKLWSANIVMSTEQLEVDLRCAGLRIGLDIQINPSTLQGERITP